MLLYSFTQHIVKYMASKTPDHKLNIRPLITDDIPTLAQFWYDQLVFAYQFNPRIKIAPHAIERWSEAVGGWCDQKNVIALTATRADEILGCMITEIVANSPGLLPEQIAILRDFTVDIHMPPAQQGVGGHLLRITREHLLKRDIQQIQVLANAYVPVEQAFWRSQGAQAHDTLFWLNL